MSDDDDETHKAVDDVMKNMGETPIGEEDPMEKTRRKPHDVSQETMDEHAKQQAEDAPGPSAEETEEERKQREAAEEAKRQMAAKQRGNGGGGGSVLGGLLETLSAPDTSMGPSRSEQLKKRTAAFQAKKALKYADKIKASNEALEMKMTEHASKKASAQKLHKTTAKAFFDDPTFKPEVTDPRKRREKAFAEAAERTTEIKEAQKLKSDVVSLAEGHADLCGQAPKYQKAAASLDEDGKEKFRDALDAAMGPSSAMMKDDVDDSFTERFKKLKEGMEDVHKKMMEALANLASALVPGR